MKKLLTLVALLSVFLGAKADWVDDYSIDYSKYSEFPFYVMGYAPTFDNGVMVDDPTPPFHKLWRDSDQGYSDVADQCTEVTVNGGTFYEQLLDEIQWRQYFIADGITTEIDGSYTVKAWVKSSESVTINVNMGWGWGDGQQKSASVAIPQSEDFVEVEWEYSGIAGTSCNLVAQPGTSTAVIVWKSLTVGHNAKPQRPTTWQEWLNSDGQPFIITEGVTNDKYMGDAETPWADPNVRYDDQENNYLICAWGKERMRNMNDDGGWDPFPCDIAEEVVDGKTNHYFIVHGKEAITEGDAAAWDNQFWIQSPKGWKSGDQLKIHFRYKASKAVTVATQCHLQNPSNYLIWHAIGDIAFSEEWQEFDGTMTIADDMNGTWSIAFQLNQNDHDAIDFCFDDLSWKSMKLDEGLYAAGCNTTTGLEYDLDNAVEFEYDEESAIYIATLGEKGKEDTYINQVMISTVRGNDAAYKSNTLKPAGTVNDDPDEWLDYTAQSLAKINLPGSGVWKIYVDTEYGAMAFEMLEGKEIKPLDIKPNPTEVAVNGLERDDIKDDDHPDATGQPWDNQFWILANRELETGEVTIIQFKYRVPTLPAGMESVKTSTQCHADPGAYLHWGAIGDVNFTEEWQDFETTFTVPSEANGMKSIAFNMAEIKEACVYELKDFVWKTEGDFETLIDMTGTKNFWVKEGAGDTIHQFGSSDIKGDVNGDGLVTVADITAVINVITGADMQYEATADVNNDGIVTIADITEVINNIK